MVAELGYTPTLCVPSEEQRFATGQIEKEQTLPLHVVSVAENFMSLNMVSEWLNVEVAIAGLVVGHRLAWPLKMWKSMVEGPVSSVSWPH